MNVLILCTGNSARSILLEVIFNSRSNGLIRAYSAGSHPTGAVNAGALRLLGRKGLETNGLRSKSWDEFELDTAPQMDAIITVCDAAANETCPYWPGAPVTAHWGVADPAGVNGSTGQIDQAFEQAYAILAARADHFLASDVQNLTGKALKDALDAASQATSPTE